MRYLSALSFVRLTLDGLFVGIFSQLLTEVRENPSRLIRLNDINSNEIMLRVFYKDGVIYAVADVSALPFVGIHVAEAFGYFCEAADRLGIRLKLSSVEKQRLKIILKVLCYIFLQKKVYLTVIADWQAPSVDRGIAHSGRPFVWPKGKVSMPS